MVQILIPSAGCWQTGLYSKLSAACWSCCLYAGRLDHWAADGPFCRHTVICPKPIKCNMYLPVDSGVVHSLDKWSKCSFRLLDVGRLGCTVSFQRHAGVAACMPADWTIGQQNGPFCRHAVIGPKPIECNMYLPVDGRRVHSRDKWSKCSFRLLDVGRLGCTVSFQRHAGVAACMPADWTIGQQMVHSAGIWI